MMKDPCILAPDPKRVIEGLRDTGYVFNTAVCDVVDNSVAAEASLIDLRLQMDFGGSLTFFIADNGFGMDEAGLLNAMKYGSKSGNGSSISLGKFGLGLKTASTAFCRRLSVVTRKSKGAEVLKATWDLDHVAQVGDWQLIFPDISKDESGIFEEITQGGSGTLVVWENTDRVLKEYSDPLGKPAQKAMTKQIDALREHLGMVYDRFLTPGAGSFANVRMKVNGINVEPWDPFCKTESELVAEVAAMPIEFSDGRTATFSLRAYVLPRKGEFSSPAAEKRAKLANNLQGIYVYRENRLISFGDWMGMFQQEPHGTLLRVEFCFDKELDEAFHVDIKKSRIILADELYDYISEKFLPAPRRAADERYRQGEKKTIAANAPATHEGSNKNIAEKIDEVKMAEVKIENAETNQVTVTNRAGILKIKLPVLQSQSPSAVHVQPTDSIEDGLLWKPCLVSLNHAVQINTSHQYYQKVYVPNRTSGVLVQGLDSLLWALAEAELGTINEKTQEHFRDMRYEVSRILRKLVEDLPEPKVDDTDGREA